jgi:predicted transcriptional regulator
MIPPEFELLKIIAAEWASRSIYIAVKFGVVEELAQGPQPLLELARKSGASADGLRRVIRGLVKLGLFAERPGDVFELTPRGATPALRAGSPTGSSCGARSSGTRGAACPRPSARRRRRSISSSARRSSSTSVAAPTWRGASTAP